MATKTTMGGLAGAEELVRNAPELMHFMGEGNFPNGSMFGQVGLLSSFAEVAPHRSRELFEAGVKRDVATLFRLQAEFATFGADIFSVVSSGPHMDGAYDKMLVKLGLLPEFPLRLLSPYQGFTDEDYRAMRQVLDERYSDWLAAPG